MTATSRPIETCNCLAVRKAARHVTQFYDSHLAPVGLTTCQFSILSKAGRQGEASISMLACDLAMDRSTLSRNLVPLEREGLVSIEGNPRDGRSRIIRLTMDGSQRVAAARQRWRVAQAAFDAAYGPDRAEHLRATMADLVSTPLASPA